MASEYTEHFNLDLYTDNDRPNLRDQYNAAIRKIDNKMFDQVTTINLLDSVVDNLKEDVEQMQTDLSNEVTTRTNADTALGTRIDNEVTARENADQTLTTNLAAEVTAREGADTTLDNKITAEVTAREGAVTAEATARETADTNLGNRITTETTARETADTALDGRITILERGITNRVYGFVGDSFSEDSTYPWVDNLALTLGCTVNNKAISGAGFARPNKTFKMQLEQLKADNVEYTDIIVYGGANDTSFTESQIRNGAISFCDYLRMNFPNKPRLHLFLGNQPFASPEQMHKIVSIARDVCIENYSNTIWYPNINGWQVANFGWLAPDNIHPNDDFRAMLPRLFANALRTGNTDISVTYYPQAESGYNVNFTYTGCLVATNTELIFPSVALTQTGSGIAGQPILRFSNMPSGAAFPADWDYARAQGNMQNDAAYVWDIKSLMRLKLYSVPYAGSDIGFSLAPVTIPIFNG